MNVHQADPHRRQRDAVVQDAIIERNKQRWANAQEWVRRATAALNVGNYDQAIALIERAKQEVVGLD